MQMADAAGSSVHPDQLTVNFEAREHRPDVIAIRKTEAHRAMDIARETSRARGGLPIFATDVRNPDNKPELIGRKFFHVASFHAWNDFYRALPEKNRCCYQIARVLPTRIYADIDAGRAENPDLTSAMYISLRDTFVAAMYAEIELVVGLPAGSIRNDVGTVGELVVLDSTSPKKLSQHLHFPNAVLRNPFHCGALLRRVRNRLLSQHESAVGVGDRDEKHPFFFWARIKDRQNPGQTIRVRTFFADLAVYTYDRNFRLYGSRKNTPNAVPLYEEGNVDGVYRQEFFDKSLLQRCDGRIPVYECLELDGSMPRSTSDVNFLRCDVSTPALALAPSGAAAAAAAAAVDPRRSRPLHTARAPARATDLTQHWMAVFPFDVLWHLTAPPSATGGCSDNDAGRREFRFVDAGGQWTRARTFASASALRAHVIDALPATIHVGPVRVGPVEDPTHIYNPTLAFDIDVNDYAKYRPCCGDSGRACARCWPILTFAQMALAAFLDEYGIEAPLFFFSGSKGVHAWVPPTCGRARRVAMSATARSILLADFASVYSGAQAEADVLAAMQFPVEGRTGAGSGAGAGAGAGSGAGAGAAAAAAAAAATAAVSSPSGAYAIPDAPAATQTRAYMRTLLGDVTEQQRWKQFLCDGMKLRVPLERHEARHGLASALAHILWPRLDAPVTTHVDHKIKAPFCVHPRSGAVATWLPTPLHRPVEMGGPVAAVETTVTELRKRLGLVV